MPLDIGLVIGVNGDGKVQGILDGFSSTGVKHGGLQKSVSNSAGKGTRREGKIYKSRAITGNPGNEDDLAPIETRQNSTLV